MSQVWHVLISVFQHKFNIIINAYQVVQLNLHYYSIISNVLLNVRKVHSETKILVKHAIHNVPIALGLNLLNVSLVLQGFIWTEMNVELHAGQNYKIKLTIYVWQIVDHFKSKMDKLVLLDVLLFNMDNIA